MKNAKAKLAKERMSNALSLFRPEFLEKLKRERFSGRLRVIWKDGKVKLFRLTTNLEFNLMKEDEADVRFFEEFYD